MYNKFTSVEEEEEDNDWEEDLFAYVNVEALSSKLEEDEQLTRNSTFDVIACVFGLFLSNMFAD